MKILYVGPSWDGSSSIQRVKALQRAGHDVTTLDDTQFQPRFPLLRKIAFRLMMGPAVDRLNQAILRQCEELQPDILWSDKTLMLRPSTLQQLRKMGIATVSYMIDNAFGPRKDPGFRLYYKAIPSFDLHCTQRDVNIPDYLSRGARAVMKVQTAYEREVHFPPPPGWSDANRDREVSFIGQPYDDRAAIFERLANAGVPLRVAGSRDYWSRALPPELMAKLGITGELFGADYREGIWRSKINLAFVTKSNQDEVAHRAFEITGCGAFLLAERSPGHMAKFVEDEEAVFFTGDEELLEKIRRYLPDEAARTQIAQAGYARAERDGYHNDHQMKLIMDRMATIVPQVKAAAAALR